MDLSGGVGRASGQGVRPLRKENRHCSGRSPDWRSHEPRTLPVGLRSQWPNVVLVHTPVHASWLNQIEIYFSIVQRKVLTPNGFKSLHDLEQRLPAFGRRYEETASPFQWTFTRKDLTTLLAKIENKRLASAA